MWLEKQVESVPNVLQRDGRMIDAVTGLSLQSQTPPPLVTIPRQIYPLGGRLLTDTPTLALPAATRLQSRLSISSLPRAHPTTLAANPPHSPVLLFALVLNTERLISFSSKPYSSITFLLSRTRDVCDRERHRPKLG